MTEEKSCWTCGNYLIGGMCFKNGVGSDYETAEHDYLCDKWIEYGAEGTITAAIEAGGKEDA